MTEIDFNEIADDVGNSTMNPIERNGRVIRVSKLRFGALFWVIVATAIFGGLITSGSKIMDAVWLMRGENAESITIPHFSVKLSNNGSEVISLPVQGLCLLWPPEPYKWDYEGAYEFKLANGNDMDSDIVSVPAESERDVQIHLTQTAPIHQTNISLARFFSTGDWHVQFHMITDQNGRNLISSVRVPFTVEAMSKRYVFEVYRKPFQRKSLS